MQVRDSVWIVLAGKRRPGIVIEVEPDLVRVAYGTTELRSWPGVLVPPEVRKGRAFPLTEDTYFYGSNTVWERSTALERGRRPVPHELLLDVRRVIERYEATIAID